MRNLWSFTMEGGLWPQQPHPRGARRSEGACRHDHFAFVLSVTIKKQRKQSPNSSSAAARSPSRRKVRVERLCCNTAARMPSRPPYLSERSDASAHLRCAVGGSTGVRSLSDVGDVPTPSIVVALQALVLRRRAAPAHKQGIHKGWVKQGGSSMAVSYLRS